MAQEKKIRILILGGGFGGLYTALELERRLARLPQVEVTLVNRDNFFLFTPMLHEVAASDLDPTDIVNPIRKLLRRVQFFAGSVREIDLKERKVRVFHGDGDHEHELLYDHLVIALGSVPNFLNLPGVEEHSITMKSLEDAVTLRSRLIEHLEEADFECCPALRDRLLTFVVAGAGFAGVETIAAASDFVREALRFYPNLREEMVRFILVEYAPRILPELDSRLGAYAQTKLEEGGIEVRLKTAIAALTEAGVELSDGTFIETKTLIWTAGTAPNPLLAALPCRKEKGKLVAESTMQVPGWPEVWALGDCAAIRDPRTGELYPATAQHALRQGRVLARNLIATIEGRAPQPFAFSTIGQLAAIGRRTGVASIMGINFSGFVAWWLWRTIYLSKLPRLEKKIRVALGWTLDLLFSKDLVQLGALPASARRRLQAHPDLHGPPGRAAATAEVAAP
ncbi:MAG TPA: NAD(P)/FAD-dependent oxidoreductase [Candidatus Acidoferrales bacterium]|nr:NAD(P)/FAD-dependent oxidoreductase [Candidatus Acidoferrales bacterium]